MLEPPGNFRAGSGLGFADVRRWVGVLAAGGVLDDPLSWPAAWRGGAGADRHLSVAARNVEHVGRLAQPGDVAGQRRDELPALLDAQPEMAGAGRQVRVMQVIGLHPHSDEAAE